jgi:hypothetical protein
VGGAKPRAARGSGAVGVGCDGARERRVPDNVLSQISWLGFTGARLVSNSWRVYSDVYTICEV